MVVWLLIIGRLTFSMNPILELCNIFCTSNKTSFAIRLLDELEAVVNEEDKKFIIGNCYQFLSEDKKAIEVYKKCFSGSLDFSEVCRRISVCYANLLQIDEAKRWIAQCDGNMVLGQEREHIRKKEQEIKYLGDITGYWSNHSEHIHSPNLANFIAGFLDKNKSLHDFGCGNGFYLARLNEAGFSDLQGYEGNPCTNSLYPNIKKQDLSESFVVERKGNVVCLEVAEHIPREYEQTFLSNITNACDGYLVFSWAIRGQGGTCHVNCRNNDEVHSYLIDLGFTYHDDLTQQGRNLIEDHCSWFRDTLMVFSNIGESYVEL